MMQKLRQCISVFLPGFARASSSHRSLLKSSFMLCVSAIVDAPPSSPLCEIPVNSVVQLILYLLVHGKFANKDKLHAALLHDIVDFITEQPRVS